jgi:CDP-glucose 4,6-dehydratase
MHILRRVSPAQPHPPPRSAAPAPAASRSDFWAGRRVLVTGHTGFKGSWLALWLHRLGASVTGFAAPPPTEPAMFELARVGELVEDLRGDVRDAAAVAAAVERAAPEVVLHLAAQPVVRRAWRHPAETFAINTLGTAHLLEAVRAHAPGAAVVVVTSDKCYAEPDSGRRFREDDRLGGEDPYSASKAAAELVAGSYRDSLGVRAATARAGNVIGGGDWAEDRLIPDAMRAALEGRPLLVRNPDAVRPWQHVLNPLAGYLLLAEHTDAAEAWNFGPDPGDELPVRDLVERIGARWGDGFEWRTEDDGGPPETTVLRLDSTKARQRLGWVPGWNLDEALAATVEWFRAEDRREASLRQIRAFAR